MSELMYKGHKLVEPKHKPVCREYWDNGLTCPCISIEEQKAIINYQESGDESWLNGVGA